MITSLISLTISPYVPKGVYCEVYLSFEGNTEELNFNIPGVPLGFALGNYFRQRVIFGRISLVSFNHGYNILPEPYIERVYFPYSTIKNDILNIKKG